MHSMDKRQAPLMMMNVANLAFFVIGVAVIVNTDMVDEQCELEQPTLALPTRSETKRQIPVLRNERESVAPATELEGAISWDASLPTHEPIHVELEDIILTDKSLAVACGVPEATIKSEPAIHDEEFSLVASGREAVAADADGEESSDSCDENSMVRCEQAELWKQVRAEHEAWSRVCEPAEPAERSIWVPVLFAMLAGAVMNVSLVTSLPACL